MGLRFRLIARLDIKGPNLIKGIHMEGLRIIGKPAEFARRYAEQGACELLYLDTVASLYGRNQLGPLLEETTAEVFIPVTVAGGIGSVSEAQRLFNAGADKVALNTKAIENPQLINEIATRCGSQAVCVSIEAKRCNGGWEAYTHCGRERTGRDAVKWAHEAVARGAGEILLTSIDQDGTGKGFDLELLEAIQLPVPVVISGGCGSPDHIAQAQARGADAVAVGMALHTGRYQVADLRH